MKQLPLRILLLIAHAMGNIIILTWLLRYDITGSWLYFLGFVALLLLLLAGFVYHLISFIRFIKSNS